MIRAFLVDDEELATKRLARMLQESGKVEVVGVSNDPAEALSIMPRVAFDVLFLDIQMPEISGFDLLARLEGDPLVVFVTAFDQFALRAFEVNSVDYLVKPSSGKCWLGRSASWSAESWSGWGANHDRPWPSWSAK